MVHEISPLDVITKVELDPTLGWVPTPVVCPNVVTICGEGDSESNELGEESVWALRGL